MKEAGYMLIGKDRNLSLDVIRCVAVFSVISVHFFRNCRFYDFPMLGKSMFAGSILRTAFMVCVPLFLLLTGYLMNHKKLCLRYYLGIKKTLGIYVLASLCCILFNIVYFKQEIDFKTGLQSLFDFSGSDYAWYIEMYMGLFLIIPFLNILYHGLQSKRQKQLLLLTILALTTLPSLCNLYGKWGANWWQNLYPVTYYFIGAYLSEYEIKLNKGWNFLLLLGSVMIFGGYNFFHSRGGTYLFGAHTDWQSFQSVTMATLLFLFLSQLNFRGCRIFCAWQQSKYQSCRWALTWYPVSLISFFIPLY